MKRLRHVATAFVFSLILLAAPAAHAAESIEHFSSDITINQDTSLTIKETINYTTDTPKHGIFRYIPYQYRDDVRIRRTKISNISVVDEQGKAYNFEKSTSKDNVVLKIGDPETTFTGDKVYILEYTVSHPLSRFDDHDELYWDITGEGWQIPINASTATVTSPFAEITKVDCYAGTIGSDDGLCDWQQSDSQVDFNYPEKISFNQNFTIVLGLAKANQLNFPAYSGVMSLVALRRLAYVIAILPTVIMFLIWYKFGRDLVFISPNIYTTDKNQPQRKKGILEKFPIPFVYEPLSISPGEAGVILDEKANAKDVIAEIIELARKKYLSIKHYEKKGIFRTSTDYTLTKLKSADSNLTPTQKYLQEKLFTSADEVTLSNLKGSFYSHFKKAQDLLTSSVKKQGLFTHNPLAVKGLSVAANVMLVFPVGGLILFLFTLTSDPIPLILFVIAFPINLVLGLNVVQRTAVGTNLMLQAKGLRETLKLAKWRDEIKEKHLFIEQIIPYSIALGVLDKLSKDMDELGMQPPQYLSHAYLSGNNLGDFSKSFSQAATASLAHNPSSSSWSSGSGFSGGSSGGGGGGGGGGSW